MVSINTCFPAPPLEGNSVKSDDNLEQIINNKLSLRLNLTIGRSGKTQSWKTGYIIS